MWKVLYKYYEIREMSVSKFKKVQKAKRRILLSISFAILERILIQSCSKDLSWK